MDRKGIKKIMVFIPGSKKKSNCRGYWLNESGKIEKDFIRLYSWDLSIKDLSGINNFYGYLDNLKQIKTNGKPQECIFYKIGNIGVIYYSRDKIVILPHRIIKEVKKENLKLTIKTDLKENSGLTIYRENRRYYIEIFKTI